eukprot:Em0001g511a
MSETFQSLSLVMSSPDKTDPKYLKLVHSVLEAIRKACQEFCPHLEVSELISDPPEGSSDHSHDTKIELSSLKKALFEGDKRIIDVNRQKYAMIEEWMKIEPCLLQLITEDTSMCHAKNKSNLQPFWRLSVAARTTQRDLFNLLRLRVITVILLTNFLYWIFMIKFYWLLSFLISWCYLCSLVLWHYHHVIHGFRSQLLSSSTAAILNIDSKVLLKRSIMPSDCGCSPRSVVSRGSRTPALVDAVSAMWHDVKSLVANEMAKVNEKMEGICQKLSTLEIKVQALMNVGHEETTIHKGTHLGAFTSGQCVMSVGDEGDLKAQNDRMPEVDLSLSSITPQEKKKLEKLLYDFRGLFVSEGGPLGRTSVVKHAIKTTGPPIREPLRRISHRCQHTVKKKAGGVLGLRGVTAQGVLWQHNKGVELTFWGVGRLR